MLGTILIVLLILMLLGALPRWPHSRELGLLPKRRSGIGTGYSGRPGFAGENLNRNGPQFHQGQRFGRRMGRRPANVSYRAAARAIYTKDKSMLQSIKQLYGDKLGASDGEIGHVNDFYFDDQNWAVRYVVADTGSWLPGRQVLLSPHAFGSRPSGRKSPAGESDPETDRGQPFD